MEQVVKDRVLRQIKEDELVKFCSKLISMPSFKTEETKVARYLANYFRRRGYEVDLQEVDPGRFQTIARLKGSGGGKSLILNGHIDIDPLAMGWKRDPFTPSHEGDRLYGGGGNNMKGGVTSIVHAAEAIRRSKAPLKGDLIVECVVGELQGGVGTVHAIQQGFTADAAIVAEPYGKDNILTTHVGWVEIVIHTLGLSKHMSQADKAIDALDMMLKVVPAVRNVKFNYPPHSGLPDMPRIIVGVMLAGRGRDHDMRGPNFTSDFCTCIADIRTVPGQTAEMAVADIKAVLDGLAAEDPNFRYEIETPPPAEYKVQRVYMNPFEVSPDEPIVRTLAGSYKEFTGHEPEQVGALVPQSYAGNDTSHLLEAGIPCCLYGPRGGGDAPDEVDGWVSVSHILQVAQVLSLTALDWCNRPR